MFTALFMTLALASGQVGPPPQATEAQQRDFYLNHFRRTCAAEAPGGGVGQLHVRSVDPAVRQEFGWQLARLYAAFQDDPAVKLTDDDALCARAIRNGLELEGLAAGLDEQIASDRARVAPPAPEPVRAVTSSPSDISNHLMSEFRSVCAGTNPKGSLERITDASESHEVRKLFGWTVMRLMVGAMTDEAQTLTPDDRACTSRLRDLLLQENMLEGLDAAVRSDLREAGLL